MTMMFFFFLSFFFLRCASCRWYVQILSGDDAGFTWSIARIAWQIQNASGLCCKKRSRI